MPYYAAEVVFDNYIAKDKPKVQKEKNRSGDVYEVCTMI